MDSTYDFLTYFNLLRAVNNQSITNENIFNLLRKLFGTIQFRNIIHMGLFQHWQIINQGKDQSFTLPNMSEIRTFLSNEFECKANDSDNNNNSDIHNNNAININTTGNIRIASLPESPLNVTDITTNIFQFLDFKTLIACRKVNSGFMHDAFQPSAIHHCDIRTIEKILKKIKHIGRQKYHLSLFRQSESITVECKSDSNTKKNANSNNGKLSETNKVQHQLQLAKQYCGSIKRIVLHLEKYNVVDNSYNADYYIKQCIDWSNQTVNFEIHDSYKNIAKCGKPEHAFGIEIQTGANPKLQIPARSINMNIITYSSTMFCHAYAINKWITPLLCGHAPFATAAEFKQRILASYVHGVIFKIGVNSLRLGYQEFFNAASYLMHLSDLKKFDFILCDANFQPIFSNNSSNQVNISTSDDDLKPFSSLNLVSEYNEVKYFKAQLEHLSEFVKTASSRSPKCIINGIHLSLVKQRNRSDTLKWQKVSLDLKKSKKLVNCMKILRDLYNLQSIGCTLWFVIDHCYVPRYSVHKVEEASSSRPRSTRATSNNESNDHENEHGSDTKDNQEESSKYYQVESNELADATKNANWIQLIINAMRQAFEDNQNMMISNDPCDNVFQMDDNLTLSNSNASYVESVGHPTFLPAIWLIFNDRIKLVLLQETAVKFQENVKPEPQMISLSLKIILYPSCS